MPDSDTPQRNLQHIPKVDPPGEISHPKVSISATGVTTDPSSTLSNNLNQSVINSIEYADQLIQHLYKQGSVPSYKPIPDEIKRHVSE